MEDRKTILARRLEQLEEWKEQQKGVPEDIARRNLVTIKEEMEYVTREINRILYQVHDD